MATRRQLAALGVVALAIMVASIVVLVVGDDEWVVPMLVLYALAVVALVTAAYQSRRLGSVSLRSRAGAGSTLLLLSAIVGSGRLALDAVRAHHHHRAVPDLSIAIADPADALNRALGCEDDVRTGATDPDSVVGNDFTCHRASGAVVVFGLFPSPEHERHWASRVQAMVPPPTIVVSPDAMTAAYSRDPAFAADVRAAGGLPD